MMPLDLATLPAPTLKAIAQAAMAAHQTLQECAAALLIQAASAQDSPPAPRVGLTPKQAELYVFIDRYQRQHGGVAPTFDEMKDAIGLVSKSGVARLLDGMEERGAIRRMTHRARALEIVGRAE